VLAVLNRVIDLFTENVFRRLLTNDTPRNRLIAAARGLRAFYGDGTKSCVTDALSLSVGIPRIERTLNFIMHTWLDAFTEIAHESGLTLEQARLNAETQSWISRDFSSCSAFLATRRRSIAFLRVYPIF